MNKSPDIAAPTGTKEEFRAQLIASIKSDAFTPELLRTFLGSLPDDKRTLFDEYRVTDIVDPISVDRSKWELSRYFYEQLNMAEQNFCLKRVAHLIAVKSYLIERGIAGFSTPKSSSPKTPRPQLRDDIMTAVFSSVDLTNFVPSRSLSNCVNGDDISSIRMALFMEMNDKRLTNQTLIQAIAWTKAKHPNLFIAYQENAYAQAIELDTSKWNDQYYSLQEVYASMNFAEKRVIHMLEVRERVFKTPPTVTSKPSITSTNRSVSNQQQPPSRAAISERMEHPQIRQTTNLKDSKSHMLKTLLLVGGVVTALALIFLAIIILRVMP